MTGDRTRTWLGLAGWVALPFVAAWFGSRFTASEWYASLDRPSWAPPSWLFGPVWTALYLAMGIAAWLVWKDRGFARARGALLLFLAQLLLNALWSWIFFGLREMGAALVEIVVLWLLIAATIAAFWRHSRPAALLLVPYLAWVTFATALNFALWRMN